MNNAHYTTPVVISAMYRAVEGMGFKGGRVLELAMGVGNFFGKLPDSMQNSDLYGVELDDITGRIAKTLYPNANIQIKGFEKTSFPDKYFDLAIGNVPFGNYAIHDKDYKQDYLIHDHFFRKALDKVAVGGVVEFVTSHGTLDKKDTKVREYLSQHANLIGAVRYKIFYRYALGYLLRLAKGTIPWATDDGTARKHCLRILEQDIKDFPDNEMLRDLFCSYESFFQRSGT